MKKWGWTLLGLLVAVGLEAQALDQPVATIKLDKKSSLVSQKAFRDNVGQIESHQGVRLTLDDKKQLLDQMVTGELIKMDMEAQGIKATDEDVLKRFRASNPGLSDADIRSQVEQKASKPWDEATAALKAQLANMKYFSQFPETQSIAGLTASDVDVAKYFEDNKSKFVAPDYVRLSQIFFDTRVKPKGTQAEIQKRAEEVLKKITSGQETFEEMATSVSEDPVSSKANGDMGYLPRSVEGANAAAFQQTFGSDFIGKVFSLKKGEISGVIASNSGLHIVRVTQKLDQKFLSLDDVIMPGSTITVRAVIKQNLSQQKIAAAEAALVTKVGDILKKKATVKTFEQNF